MRSGAARSAAIAMLMVGAVSLLFGGCGSAPAGQSTGTVTLNETGSSLLYPLFNIWVTAYAKTKTGHSVRISTQSSGSGTGISDAINGTVQIGASDAYMSNAELAGAKGMLNIPLAISAQQIMYNVPGLNSVHLHISGPILAGIYTGAITTWNNPQIVAANPGVRLPNLRIIPIHRLDGSGDTFLFSQYLSFTNPTTWGGKGGPQYGTIVPWPTVSGGVAANGNAGMVVALQQNKGGIAYVGISYLAGAVKSGLGYAALRNQAGNYVLPTAQTISAAAAAKYPSTPRDERISLVYASGASSYPIINYEYAVVNRTQPSAALAKAIRDLLSWAISPSGGSAQNFLSQVHFLPLPAPVAALSRNQVSKIK